MTKKMLMSYTLIIFLSILDFYFQSKQR